MFFGEIIYIFRFVDVKYIEISQTIWTKVYNLTNTLACNKSCSVPPRATCFDDRW